MRQLWGTVVALAACYQPTASPGAPCGPNGECPSGLDCQNDRCLPPGTGTQDAAVEDAVPADAAMSDAPDAAPGYVPWGAPVEIASLETPGTNETDPTMSPNKLTAVVATSSSEDLYLCTRGAVTAAFTCAPFTAVMSTATDKSPELTANGTKLYFSTNRGGNYDIYVSTLSGTTWGPPMLDDALSTAGEESDIAISPDGLTAAVVENGATNHILIATRLSTLLPFGTPAVHSELEVTTDIATPTITNGGAVIYFHAGATRDIYTAVRKPNGTYAMPAPVNELNTAGRDAAPFVFADDKYMVFEREGDIYETSR
jgi:hypothetical protein